MKSVVCVLDIIPEILEYIIWEKKKRIHHVANIAQLLSRVPQIFGGSGTRA